MIETTSQLLQDIGALILAFIIWLELKTGLIFTFFALYDEYPHVIHAILLVMSLFFSHMLISLFQRRERIPQRFEPFSSSPYAHRRTRTPEFPPAMEFNQVQERWKKEGMEEPFLERRVFGASRPAEVPPVRRPMFSVPIVTSQLPQSDKRPVHASFGKIGWS